MKVSDFSQWDIPNSKALLFFAQSLEEMLFHYGHDSIKVPALNFHFLCIETISCIQKIENAVIDKANMKPLFNELSSMYTNDPIANALYGNVFNNLFFFKDVNGEYKRDCNDLYKDASTEVSIRKIQRTVEFLIDDMENNQKYYMTLKDKISAIITKTTFDEVDSNLLYKLCRILLTELINTGYSQEYIYRTVLDTFYSTNIPITSTIDTLDTFWNNFSFTKKKFSVVLPLRKLRFLNQLKNFSNVTIETNKDKYFKNSCKFIIKVDIDALDPEQARKEALSLISFFVSLLQYNSHGGKAFHESQAIVIDLETEVTFFLNEPVTLLARGHNYSAEEINKRVYVMTNNFHVFRNKMISIIGLHSAALESKDINNQLLNLWTIIEILIDIERKNNYSKINQICNILTSVLNASYIRTLLNQLILDLTHCVDNFSETIDTINKGDNTLEKFISLLILDEYNAEKLSLLRQLDNYPVLQYRINTYCNKLSNRLEIKKLLENHRKRIEWQIMRIYRNRNMIVHDGTHFPYINIIVQNLHFYVDTLIDTINAYANNGYTGIDTIYSAIQKEELDHLLILEEKIDKNMPAPITNNFSSIILGNNYFEL